MAAARGVFNCSRVRGPACSIFCSISTPPTPLAISWNGAGPLSQSPLESDVIIPLLRRRARLERGLFTHLQGPLGVQKAVKLDKFGYEPGPAGLVAGA
jgi:hypothetical protein